MGADKRRYLEKILNDEVNYAQGLVNKVFLYANQTKNQHLLIEFCRNLKKIYFGLGKKSFEKYLLPNLKDCIISGNKNILVELSKAIKFLPIRSDEISASLN